MNCSQSRSHITNLIRDNSHLYGVTIIDNDKKNHLPVHVMLGRGEHARIKMESKPRVSNDGEPVAEFTKPYGLVCDEPWCRN